MRSWASAQNSATTSTRGAHVEALIPQRFQEVWQAALIRPRVPGSGSSQGALVPLRTGARSRCPKCRPAPRVISPRDAAAGGEVRARASPICRRCGCVGAYCGAGTPPDLAPIHILMDGAKSALRSAKSLRRGEMPLAGRPSRLTSGCNCPDAVKSEAFLWRQRAFRGQRADPCWRYPRGAWSAEGRSRTAALDQSPRAAPGRVHRSRR